MAVVTFEQRRAKIKTIDDLEEQIRLSRTYLKRLRLKAVNAATLDDKLAINEDVKAAEKVVRTLRYKSFEIEDEILAEIRKGTHAEF